MDMLEPGRFGYAVNFKKRYGNYIGGEWVPPVKGEYFENITPITGRAFCEIPRSSAGAGRAHALAATRTRRSRARRL